MLTPPLFIFVRLESCELLWIWKCETIMRFSSPQELLPQLQRYLESLSNHEWVESQREVYRNNISGWPLGFHSKTVILQHFVCYRFPSDRTCRLCYWCLARAAVRHSANRAQISYPQRWTGLNTNTATRFNVSLQKPITTKS